MFFFQAHSQARYAILQVMLEADGLLRIEERTGEDGNPDLLIKLERSKISTEGKRVIGDFLRKLQVSKVTGEGKEILRLKKIMMVHLISFRFFRS